MSVESPQQQPSEDTELIQQSKLQECVARKIPKVKEDHPEMDHDQAVAVAFSMCREILGINKADLLRMLEVDNLFDGKLLRLLETGKIFNIQLQKQILQKIKSNLDKENLIQYGLLLRKEGKSSAEVAEQIPYSESWVKKYVNPKITKVTSKAQNIIEQLPYVEYNFNEIIGQFSILDIQKSQRRFTAYATVEQEDSQGDILSVKGLVKNMPTYMRRGGTVLFSHGNRPVGKVLKWEERTIPLNNTPTNAVIVDIEVFQDYIGDDLAWACVLQAQEKNLPILSYGATPTSPPEKVCDEVKCVRKFNDIQPYEISIVNVLQGIVGANPGAKIVSVGGNNTTQKPSLHPLVGGKLAKAHDQGLISDDIELLDYALNNCDLCKQEYAAMIQKGIDDDEAKKSLLIELKKEMTTVLDEKAELMKEGAQEVTAPEPMDNMLQMMKRIEQMLTRIMPQQAPPQGEAKAVEEPVQPVIQPENMTKASVAKIIQAEVQKQLSNISPEALINLAKSKGLDVITTPAPSAATTTQDRPPLPDDLTKGQDNDHEYTDEELLNFMGSSTGAQEISENIRTKRK